jgi:catechol 2,3-dioxygenase-like lactoylglutathione lyase family enzyme
LRATATAISLTVDDVSASSHFFTSHLGFHEKMAADGFVSLDREDVPANVIFLRRGIEVLPEEQRHERARGLILALVVEDLDAELERLTAEGVRITLPLRVEEWGERLFQVTDPNGVVVELVEWVDPSAEADWSAQTAQGIDSDAGNGASPAG